MGTLGKQADPATMLNMMKAMRDMNPTPAAAPPADSGVAIMMPLIMQMMQNQAAQTLELMKALSAGGAGKQAAPADPLQQLETFTQIAQTMQGFLGGNAAAAEPVDPKWKLLEGAIEQLGPALQVMAQSWAMPSAAAPAVRPRISNAPPARPGAPPQAGYPHDKTAPLTAEAQPQEVPDVLIPQAIIERATELSVQVYRQMLNGNNGSEYAASFIELLGENAYHQVANRGPVTILDLFQRIDPIRERFADNWPALETFVREFCAPNFEDDTEDPPPLPPAAVATKPPAPPKPAAKPEAVPATRKRNAKKEEV